MEMNPFTLDPKGSPFPLDMRGELDDTAAFKSGKKWGDLEFPLPFGRTMTSAEEHVHTLDSNTGMHQTTWLQLLRTNQSAYCGMPICFSHQISCCSLLQKLIFLLPGTAMFHCQQLAYLSNRHLTPQFGSKVLVCNVQAYTHT